MEKWISPVGVVARMLHFDFRDGGSYRMRLAYFNPQTGRGKATDDSDEVEVRLVRLAEGKEIEQEVEFRSQNPVFAGVMRMIWRLVKLDAFLGGTP